MSPHGANSSSVDILYLVRTAGAHHTTRLPAVLSTWAAALPRLLVVSERDDAVAAALVAKRGGRFVVAVGCGGDHTSGLCCKTWAALRAAWRERAAFTMFADDDALIFAPNLARTLAKLPDLSGATPYYLGNAWCRSRKAQIEDGGPNICGGGGYVLSRSALAKLDFDGGEKDAKADPLVRACSEYSTVDDAALNLVMAKVGVLPTHCNAFHYSFTRDATAPHRLSQISTDPERRGTKPVSFHLRGQSTTRQRALHALLCSEAAVAELWVRSADATEGKWCDNRRSEPRTPRIPS